MSPAERRIAVARDIGTSADDFGPAELHLIANGPIMNPGAIYLPAGCLSPAETAAREARILAGLPS